MFRLLQRPIETLRVVRNSAVQAIADYSTPSSSDGMDELRRPLKESPANDEHHLDIPDPSRSDQADLHVCPPTVSKPNEAIDYSRGGEIDDAAQLRIPLAPESEKEFDHEHYSQRAPWLRAFVLGANDGLVTVASLMLGVGSGTESQHTVILSGVAGLVGGALSMACGEYVSVASQKDAEEADINKEAEQQRRGPRARAYEFNELKNIYVQRGLSEDLAYMVAKQLSEKDPVRAHVRDELGIDMESLANPWQASFASAIAFSTGGGIPLLAGAFLHDPQMRTIVVAAAATVGLILFGSLGAWLGDAHKFRGAMRVLVGGVLAMGITYGVGRIFGVDAA